MRKLVAFVLALSLFTPYAQAADIDNFGNIDTIMEDNALSDIATRYSAVQLSFFPEYATRLGFTAAEDRLDRRERDRDTQALRALNIVQEALDKIQRKQLSEPKKTEYDILRGMIAYDIYNIRRDRIANDPLLYANVFDALYDLRIKQMNYNDIQKRDLAARLAGLSSVAKQVEKNLINPPSFWSQLAMEQAYYAYLSFDEIEDFILGSISDETAKSRISTLTRESKKAIKNMFDSFKKIAQEQVTQDFRLGSKSYETVLKNHYFINQKENAIANLLQKNLQASQQNLALAIKRFPSIDQLQQEDAVSVENITETGAPIMAELIEPATEAVTEQSLEITEAPIDPEATDQVTAPQPAPKADKKKQDKKKKKNNLANAEDFYILAQYLKPDIQQDNFIAILSEEAVKLNNTFIKEEILPQTATSFKIREMPKYYAYYSAYKFMPPFGTQSNPTHDLLLRLPFGDAETQESMLQQDFNIPALKLLISGQLVPGLAFRSAAREDQLSAFRKMYPVVTLRNGWEVYAQHLAQEQGYINSDEELLFLAWVDYVRAVQAILDFKVHTQRFTYQQALDWLIQKQGFGQEPADAILKQATAAPGEAVSYIYGYETLKNLRAKYQKKLGKKFNLKDFHSKLISLGDIPPARLEPEMEYTYQLDKNRMAQALVTPFYL